MLNKTLFSQMMTMLCEVYAKEQSKQLMETYYFILKEMCDEDFRYSVQLMLKNRVYPTFPKPAEIFKEKILDSSKVWINVLRKKGMSEDEIALKINEWEFINR